MSDAMQPPATATSPSQAASKLGGAAADVSTSQLRPLSVHDLDLQVVAKHRCPCCPPLQEWWDSLKGQELGGSSSVQWIGCDKCKVYYHLTCMQLESAEAFLSWFCPACIEESVAKVAAARASDAEEGKSSAKGRVRLLESKLRPSPRRTARQRAQVDYAAIEQGRPPNSIDRWQALIADEKRVLPDRYKRMRGEEWSMKWIECDEDAFMFPVMVPSDRRWKLENQRQSEYEQRCRKRKERKDQWVRDHPDSESETDEEEETDRVQPVNLSDILAEPVGPVVSEPPQFTDRPRLDIRPVRTTIPGMLVPPPDMTIWDIADLLGHTTSIEVIDVVSQTSSLSSTNSIAKNYVTVGKVQKAWTLAAWAEYFHTPGQERKKVLNVISLEVSGTHMEEFVQAPKLVRELDWVTRDWPKDKIPSGATMKGGDGATWPKVQRYVLMGVQGAFTDWHVDFAASSVYYHVVFGQKTFLFAPPTKKNLRAYKDWSSSPDQDTQWLGADLERVTRVDVYSGDTLLIPSGWIHSVYTPVDTLVVGGNFLHDLGVATQLKLVEIENQSMVQRKAKFPHLKKLMWYVAANWGDRLEAIKQRKASSAHDPIPPLRKVIPGLQMILQHLQDDVELLDEFANDDDGQAALEESNEKLKKEWKAAKASIPYALVRSDAKRAREALQSLSELLDQKDELEEAARLGPKLPRKRAPKKQASASPASKKIKSQNEEEAAAEPTPEPTPAAHQLPEPDTDAALEPKAEGPESMPIDPVASSLPMS